MKSEQRHVREWMVKAGQPTPDRPGIPDEATCKPRLTLIAEELQELANALGYNLYFEDDSKGIGAPALRFGPVTSLGLPDLVEAYDGVCDLTVVVIGTAVALGVKLKPGFDEVMSSNDSKFIDGHRREDGKWIKGPSYRPVVLAPLLAEQTAAAEFYDKMKPTV